MNVGRHSERNALTALAFAAALLLAAPSSPNVMPTSRAPQGFAANWLKFDTDECGRLSGVEGRVSTRTATAASDDVDDEDDDDNPWANAWNIPDDESEAVTGWLQKHPEVATITDGVEKTCDEDNAPVEDLDDVDIA